MKINLLCIGKTDDKEIKNLINYYLTRLPRHWNFEITEIPDVKNARNLTPDLLKKEEAKLFLNQIENTDLVVLLDEKRKTIYQQRICPKIRFLSKQFYQKNLFFSWRSLWFFRRNVSKSKRKNIHF